MGTTGMGISFKRVQDYRGFDGKQVVAPLRHLAPVRENVQAVGKKDSNRNARGAMKSPFEKIQDEQQHYQQIKTPCRLCGELIVAGEYCNPCWENKVMAYKISKGMMG